MRRASGKSQKPSADRKFLVQLKIRFTPATLFVNPICPMPNVSNLIKTIQDIMRKDAGVDGDAQRLAQLGWMFFLKIFDDREKEMEVLRDNYKSPLPNELRWSNWATDEEGITGDALLAFANNDLLPRLKVLYGTGDIVTLIKAAFDEEGLADGGAATGCEDVFDGDVLALPGLAAALGWPGWDAVLGFGIEPRVGGRSMRPMNQRHWQTWDLCQRSSSSARGPCRRGDPP